MVILGDSNSMGGESWVEIAADRLSWGSVTNLSEQGRGYISEARSCTTEPCTNFAGAVDAAAEADPDVVIVFGGTADGDQDIRPAAVSLFEELRSALPDAELVGIAPTSAEDPTPYWMVLHGQSVQSAAAAVDGTFIDVGQPGRGDGQRLSSDAQEEIADRIVQELE